MYEHSGITIYLDSVLNGWDSGQLGLIFITEKDFLKEYGKKTKSNLKKAEEVLKNEFENYKDYVEGNVYSFQLFEKVKVEVTKKYENETITTQEEEEILKNSCCNYFGENGLTQIKEENGFN